MYRKYARLKWILVGQMLKLVGKMANGRLLFLALLNLTKYEKTTCYVEEIFSESNCYTNNYFYITTCDACPTTLAVQDVNVFFVRVDYIYQLCSQHKSRRVWHSSSPLHNEVGTNDLQFLNMKLKTTNG